LGAAYRKWPQSKNKRADATLIGSHRNQPEYAGKSVCLCLVRHDGDCLGSLEKAALVGSTGSFPQARRKITVRAVYAGKQAKCADLTEQLLHERGIERTGFE
jgi:hypothetical protein